MPAPTKLAHVVLQTYDVPRLVDWYCKVLSARVVFEKAPQLCFITYDDEHHRMGFTQIPGKPVAHSDEVPGLRHHAYTFANIGALLDTYEGLKAKGIMPHFTINHGPTVSFYYQDPDSNGVELQVDCFATAEEAQHFIDDNFARNPVGVACDPEALLAMRRNGASDAQLMHYDASLGIPKLPVKNTLMDEVHGKA